MKTLLKVGTALVLGSGIIMVIFAFVLKKTEAKSVQDLGKSESRPFPELLVRNDALKQTAEWQSNVQRVSALCSQLIQKPNDVQSLVELAQIYCIEARVTGEHGYYFPAILEMLDRSLSQAGISEKDLFEATALKANVLLSQHRFQEGLLVAEQAHTMNPHSAQVFAALIDAHVELGHYARAVELSEQMMDIKPGLMAYARVSYLRELHDDLEGAITAMEMAVEAGYPGYENTEWSRLHLAELYEKKGDFGHAEKLYLESLQYRENNPFANAGLAGIMIERGAYREAETLLKSALSIAPEIGFQEKLCTLYKTLGRTQEATDAYAGVIAMIEDDAAHGHQVALDYAKILFDLGDDPVKSFAYAMQEYARRPDNLEVNALLARLYAIQGNKELARTHLEKATQTGYSTPELNKLRETLG